MKDIVTAALQLVNHHLGLDINSSAVPYIIVACAIFGLAWSFRRRLRDLRKISDKMESATKEITGDTTEKIGTLLDRFRELNGDLQSKIDSGFTGIRDELRVFAKPSEPVKEERSDPEVEASQQAEAAAQSKMTPTTRLGWATQARDAVVAKWLDGRDLKPSTADANVYEYQGRNGDGQLFALKFLTPYRASAETDGRLPFALDLWVENRKKLNFEWDTDGNYALRGFTRGTWFEDIAYWNLVAVPNVTEERRVA